MSRSSNTCGDIAQEKTLTGSSMFSMTKKILWSPPFHWQDGQPRSDDGTTTPVVPPIFTFPDGILSEVQATVSYAFSSAVQLASVYVHQHNSVPDGNGQSAKPLPQPIISLYYPHDRCHDIIDSMVTSLAHEQGADIVVLDSLELALEEFGAFGKETAHAIDILYKVPRKPVLDRIPSHHSIPSDYNDFSDNHDTETSMIQKVFNDIVNIRQDPSTHQGCSSSVEQTQSRIIYLRDFGSIALSAQPLVPYLLQALRNRRTARFDNGSLNCERQIQPTVLILGIAETPKDICEHTVSHSGSSPGSSKGEAAFRQMLPSLGSKLSTIKNGTLPSSFKLSPFSTTFFLTSLAQLEELNMESLGPESNFELIPCETRHRDTAESNSSLLNSPFIFVFPNDSHTPVFREIEQRMSCRRTHDIQSAWMMICLRRRGGTIRRNPLDSIQDDDTQTLVEGVGRTTDSLHVAKAVPLLDRLHMDTDIPFPIVLDRIATIALGLSQLSGSMTDIQVTPTALSRSYKLFAENLEARSNWVKAVTNNQSNDKKGGDCKCMGPDKKGLEHNWMNEAVGFYDEDDGGGDYSGMSYTGGFCNVKDRKGGGDCNWTDEFGKFCNVLDEEWTDESEGDCNGEDDTGQDHNKEEESRALDPIIQKVKQAKDLSAYERKLLGCIVDDSKLTTSFEDVCISSKIINSLRTIVSLPLLYPAAFKTGILAKEAIGGVLLYGPPGTGKTLLCRALARESGARMLQIKPSDIMDLYLGQSEKLAKSIFSLAYRLAPCVIFIDEMDALFRERRGSDDPQYFRSILNEFLQSMDGLQSAKRNKDAGVVVVGATNRPYDLDNAVLRRLGTWLMVDLPSAKEREQILGLLLRDENFDKDVNLCNIASQTASFSGSDLKNLCVSAAMASVKDAVPDFSWTPKKPIDGAESKIVMRTIKLAHFMHAFKEVSSSSEGSHSELRRWHDRVGLKRTLSDGDSIKFQIDGLASSASCESADTSGYGSKMGKYGGNAGDGNYDANSDGRYSWRR